MEGDNAIVMRGLTTICTNKSVLENIYEDARYLAMRFRSLSASCVQRRANTAAHSLAHFAKFIDEDYVWLEEPPPPAREALYLDSHVADV